MQDLLRKHTVVTTTVTPSTVVEQASQEEEETTTENKKPEFPKPDLGQMLPFKPRAFARKFYCIVWSRNLNGGIRSLFLALVLML